MSIQVLVLHNDKARRQRFCRWLADAGYEVGELSAPTEEQLGQLLSRSVRVVVVDVDVLKDLGVKYLGHMVNTSPVVRKVVVGNLPSLGFLVKCMEYGADDFVSEPEDSPKKLIEAVQRALERIERWTEIARNRSEDRNCAESFRMA